MKRHNYFQVVFTTLLVTSQAAVVPPPPGCTTTSSAVVSALLPLHSGPTCTTLTLRGLQQLAALRAVISEVNTEMKAQDGLTIGLQVQDTCSSPDGAMRAALHSLVDTQQTCSNPPLYLGMVGPEDAASLGKVKGVSKVFNATHVLPTYHSTAREDDSVFYVSIERTREEAQSVLTLLKQLHWQSFSLAFEEPLAELAEVLIQSAKEGSALCVSGSISRLNLQTAVPNIFAGSQDGVVVLVQSHQMAAQVLQAYQSLAIPLVLLVRTVGLESWQIPRSATKFYLMQQVSVTTEGVADTINKTLKEEYEKQRQEEFQNVHCKNIVNAKDCALESSSQDTLVDNIDASVTAMANGVRLMSAALRTVHRNRCMAAGSTPTYGMCPKLLAMPTTEWRTALRRATTTTQSADNHRVRFLMELPTTFHLFSRDSAAGDLVKVAALTGGHLKDVLSGYAFPVLVHTSNTTSCGATPHIPSAQAPQVTAPPFLPPALSEEDSPTLRDLYTSEYSFYELIGMICGVGFIMFGLMVVIIYLIYNNLVEKTEKESTGGSLETVRSSRPARRNFRDTFRRNSSARASNRS